ncbi:MAG: hypothetical protein CL450_09160 [Acidimicrobiaceae bacterium]|nr:hypothetical protein [Acidimicrobiaceae bacterium]|tara:strand:- start:1301 stop:3013 length:1713 start_codon:yes stop_codon:yes gene_type:complete
MSAHHQRLQWDFMKKKWLEYTGFAVLSIAAVYLKVTVIPENVAGLTKVLSNTPAKIGSLFSTNPFKNVSDRHKTVGGVITVLTLAYVVAAMISVAKDYILLNFLPAHLEHCRNQMFKQLVERYKTEYNDLPPAKVIARLLGLSRLYVYQSQYVVGTWFPYIIGMVAIIVYTFRKNRAIGATVSVVFITSMAVTICTGEKVASCSDMREGVYIDMVGKMNDNFSNMMNVYVNNKEGDAVDENLSANQLHTQYFKKELQESIKSSASGTAITIAGFAVVMSVGFYMLKKEKIKAFDLAAIATLYVMFMGWSVRMIDNIPYIFRRIGIWYQHKDFIHDLFGHSKLERGSEHITNGSLHVQNLVFSYPGKDQAVLQNMNLRVDDGETVAIIGRSGSGKSTLMKILVGLHHPTSGTVRIGGANVDHVNTTELREKVYYVNQRNTLLDDTVLANLQYGNDADRQTVVNLMDEYDLHCVFDGLSRGIDSDAGIGGANLSLGMSKAVIVLRALLKPKQPLIYLFDEPVAGLDPETRGKIMHMIKTKCRGKTVICVTHLQEIQSFVERVISLNNDARGK